MYYHAIPAYYIRLAPKVCLLFGMIQLALLNTRRYVVKAVCKFPTTPFIKHTDQTDTKTTCTFVILQSPTQDVVSYTLFINAQGAKPDAISIDLTMA